MSNNVAFAAEARTRVGKGPNRALRRNDRIPAVIYGEKKDPVLISMTRKEIQKEYDAGRLFSQLCHIEVDGKSIQVLPREAQAHPVTSFLTHVDFLRVSKGASIVVVVPVIFDNEETCPGIKRGGVLNIVRRELELNVPAEAIPDSIHLDLGSVDIGDSVHISHVALPEGVTPTITDRDFTICTVVAPSGGVSDEAEEGGEEAEGAAEE